MKILMTITLMILLILTLLVTLLNTISKKTFSDREKSSPFECGFDPSSSSRLPFSLHFFLIAIIFLIFDVEITLLFPFISTLKFSAINSYAITMTVFIFILIIGLLHEWKQGALNWN
uniref:NADH dehydrogenase subunit 3 n=1 Tax=Chlorophila portschinski TaxID=2969964 RepID=UPI002176C802|nr:NADH dehydrogenase subunit 3 [Chlorophila portschinski]UUL71658.1 NADH dehydrogenase subunit 3 [Chlorophila portschinski]